jgi:hypothetical protein
VTRPHGAATALRPAPLHCTALHCTNPNNALHYTSPLWCRPPARPLASPRTRC